MVHTITEQEFAADSESALIQNRKFANLDWRNGRQEGLTFKNCTISDSDFTDCNMDGLRLENCRILNWTQKVLS